jgi:hypothetical protein
MKTLAAIFTGAAILLFASPISAAKVAVSIDFFYEALDPYGDWIYADDYGYCFRPALTVEDPEWRPYSDGQWVYTDAGWTWVSNEDFGWACYHYGRWVRVNYEWVWVPGIEWGPAWVSWRRSPRYVGWAPLPPEAEWHQDVGFSGWVDAHYDIGPTCYNFVEVRSFGLPRLRPVLIAPERNVTILRETTNITNIVYRPTNIHVTKIYNGGPDYDEINRLSERRIRRLKIEENAELEPQALRAGRFRNRVEGGGYFVAAPPIELPDQKVRPAKVKARFDKAAINRGWARVNQNEAAVLREKLESEAAKKKPPVDLPPKPRAR